MQCQHAHEIFSDYVAGQLDRALTVTLENHINECAACREDVVGLKRVWNGLSELPVVDTPPFFHENLMHRIHAEMVRQDESAVRRRGLWNPRALFQPRVFAAAAVILIVLLGGIGYVETQPAALGPFGFLLGRASHKPTTLTPLQQPKIDWGVDNNGAKTLRVQFQLDSASVDAGAKYTIALSNGVGTAKDVLTHMLPVTGKVDILIPLNQIPLNQAQDATDNELVITIHSLQDGAQKLAEWHGTLPPQQ